MLLMQFHVLWSLLIQCIYIYIYIMAGPHSDFFTIKMHHGGEFVKQFPYAKYTPDRVGFFDYCEFDKMSMVELITMGGHLGFSGMLSFYFSVEDGKFVLIDEDSIVLLLKNILNEDREIGI